jgi:hypothetical protein
MLHRLEIQLTSNLSQWQISAWLNLAPMTINGSKITHEFCFEPNNQVEIIFNGKDASVNPDMYVGIETMYLDYIDVTPVLKYAVYHTDHPDYPIITPCTDINLNGTWRLIFSQLVLKQQITNYLGINDVI